MQPHGSWLLGQGGHGAWRPAHARGGAPSGRAGGRAWGHATPVGRRAASHGRHALPLACRYILLPRLCSRISKDRPHLVRTRSRSSAPVMALPPISASRRAAMPARSDGSLPPLMLGWSSSPSAWQVHSVSCGAGGWCKLKVGMPLHAPVGGCRTWRQGGACAGLHLPAWPVRVYPWPPLHEHPWTTTSRATTGRTPAGLAAGRGVRQQQHRRWYARVATADWRGRACHPTSASDTVPRSCAPGPGAARSLNWQAALHVLVPDRSCVPVWVSHEVVIGVPGLPPAQPTTIDALQAFPRQRWAAC